MSRSTWTARGLVDVGSFDGDDDTDWLILKLVTHALVAGVLGLGLLLAVLQGFFSGYLLGDSTDPRSD